MNKFAQILSREHSSIREARAKNISEEALYAQEEIIRNLEKKKRELDKVLLDLQDLAPSTTFSLDVTNGKFDAENWAKKLQETKVSIKLVDVELDIAKETKEDFFGETKNK